MFVCEMFPFSSAKSCLHSPEHTHTHTHTRTHAHTHTHTHTFRPRVASDGIPTSSTKDTHTHILYNVKLSLIDQAEFHIKWTPHSYPYMGGLWCFLFPLWTTFRIVASPELRLGTPLPSLLSLWVLCPEHTGPSE